jgi:hypothetical protein
MLAVLKLGCLVLYAAAIAAWSGLWHDGAASVVEWVGAAFIVIHVTELPVFWRALHAYRGPFALSVLQALLFGVLHSLPLQRAARA